MDKWANQPRTGRLTVQETGENKLTFIDHISGDKVEVFIAPNFEDVTMRANGKTITRADAKHFEKGKRVARRDVWHYVTRETCNILRAGLTVHKAVVSSTPHDFETRPTQGFEEVFTILLPEGGKGLVEGHGKWPNGLDVDDAWPVYDRQFVQIPMGWHRVVGLPAEDGVPPLMGYVWCYVCDRPEWEKD